MHTPPAGEHFNTKYKVLGVLGHGGFADVLHARDVEIGRDVAIKVLRPRDGMDPVLLEKRFMREAQVIAALSGPHAIRMYEFGRTDDGLLFMVFEHVRGRTLSDVLNRGGPLPAGVVEHVLRQLLVALREAHGLGILHRDVKPANILIFEHLDDPYRVKLIDFGIAKLFERERRENVTQLTADGAVIGTPRYLPPESFFGEELSPSSDLYSLGLVAWEMLSGSPAIGGESNEEILRNQLSPVPLDIPDIAGATALCKVIRRMVAREPAERFQTTDAVLAALDAPRTVTRSAPLRGKPPPAAKRFPIPVLTGLGAVLLVVVLGYVLANRDTEDQADGRALPVPLTRAPSAVIRSPASSPPPAVPDAAQPATGCRSRGETGRYRDSMVVDLSHREFWVYVPENTQEPMPVVLVAHKLFGDPREFIRETRLDRTASEYGFIVVSLKIPLGDEPATTTRKAFEDALRMVGEDHCIDETRLYIIGHAGGGRAARNLSCIMPLSGIATTSDGVHDDEEPCEPIGPTPHLRIYGRDDPHLPLDGKSVSCTSNYFRAPGETNAIFRRFSGSQSEPVKWVDSEQGRCQLWDGPATYASCDVEGGFDWPGAKEPIELPGCGSDPMDFPVRDTIWRFFAEFGRDLPR